MRLTPGAERRDRRVDREIELFEHLSRRHQHSAGANAQCKLAERGDDLGQIGVVVEVVFLDVVDHGAAYARVVQVLRDEGEVGSEVSMLKIWVSETFQRIADMMLDVSGEDAVLDESETLEDGTSIHVAKQYFLARPASIYAGTNQIQRNIIAKVVLGLPRS